MKSSVFNWKAVVKRRENMRNTTGMGKLPNSRDSQETENECYELFYGARKKKLNGRSETVR